MNMIERIAVMIGIIALPTIMGAIPSIIFHGNFDHMNPYEWEEWERILWTVCTTAMVFSAPIIAFTCLTDLPEKQRRGG